MAKVNPPPILRRPPSLARDGESDAYLRQLEWIVFQLWSRTGGAEDAIETNEEPAIATAFAQLKDLADRVGSGELLTSDTDSFTVDSTLFYCDETEA